MLDLPSNLKYLHLENLEVSNFDRFEQLPQHLWGLVLLKLRLNSHGERFRVSSNWTQPELLASLQYFQCDAGFVDSNLEAVLKHEQRMDSHEAKAKLDHTFWNP
jgi:hypothetical protein